MKTIRTMPHNIRCRYPLLCITLFGMGFSGRCFGQQNIKDTIFMKNGQVLSGELKSLKSGRVEFDVDDITIINIKFDRIRMIKGLTHSYRIETSDHKIYIGKIHRGDEPGTVRIELADSSIILPINQISYLTALNQKNLRTIKGYISSGFSYTRSSRTGRFNFDGAAHSQLKKMQVDVAGNMFITQTDTNWINDRASLALSGYYMLSPWVSVGGSLSTQRNYELGLARRVQEGLGGKLNLLKHNNFQITALSGVVFNQEKNTEGETYPTQVEIPFQIYLEYFRFSNPEISINSTLTAYMSLTDAGRFRWDGDNRISWKIINDFFLSLQLYHNYDSRPLTSTGRNWDYGVVFGLKYEVK